jgi:hypothetical protein
MTSSRALIAVGALGCFVLVGLYAYRLRHHIATDAAGSMSAPAMAGSTGSARGPGATSAEGGATAGTGTANVGDPTLLQDGRATGASGSPAIASVAPGSNSQAPAASGTSAITPPKSGPAAMPYRPANVLRWSDQPPASGRSGDLSAPALQRILEVAKPDDEQKQKIIDLWTAHEDQRRALLAAAPRRASGPPIPDQMKSAENDFKFESTLLSNVLRRDQLDRLVPQIYPPKPKH